MNCSESDLLRSAGRMVRDHGGDALRKAQTRADWLDKVGARDAAEIWRLIAARCADLLRPAPAP